MSLVTLQNVSLVFVGRELFKNIGLQVEAEDRMGLIGPNGSGKTTLLRLILGDVSPHGGDIRVSKGVRIGYLPQDVQETLSGTLLGSVVESAPRRVELQGRLKALEDLLNQVQDRAEQSLIAAQLAEIHQQVHDLDLAFPVHEAKRTLMGLGFKANQFERPVSILSGGWKTRATLARLLYQRPDLLLLDEPTNHLDIPSIRWFESHLRTFRGAMVLISHDSDFLNRHVNRVVSFEPEGMRCYTGNYVSYVKSRDEERRSLEAKARRQDQRVKEAQKFIDRFKVKASKARQAQSKIKLIKKMQLVETHRREKTLRFSFPPVLRSGREVLSIKALGKGFDGDFLYRDVNLTVLRGERVAVIGANGSGKTTLLRMVANEVLPTEGSIALGTGVTLSYFAQHHSEMLNPQKSVVQEVYQVVPQETLSFVRGVCGAFLFSGDEVDKPIGVLSGGERARVSLAKLLVRPGNFMVMDEPTNHLDISSSETLIQALTDYEGTLLFVSHNQAFIKRLATRIWDIQGGVIIDYPGTLEEYYDHLTRAEALSTGNESQVASLANGFVTRSKESRKHEPETRNQEPSSIQIVKSRKDEKRERAERRRMIQEALDPIMNNLHNLEKTIGELETRQKELEKRLADPDLFRDKEKSVPLMKGYHELRERLQGLYQEWEARQLELESTKRSLGL